MYTHASIDRLYVNTLNEFCILLILVLFVLFLILMSIPTTFICKLGIIAPVHTPFNATTWDVSNPTYKPVQDVFRQQQGVDDILDQVF